jgi:hypothetical protein
MHCCISIATVVRRKCHNVTLCAQCLLKVLMYQLKQIPTLFNCSTWLDEIKRRRRKSEENIKAGLKETGCKDLKWIDLAHNTDYWRSILIKITNIHSTRIKIIYHVDITRPIYKKKSNLQKWSKSWFSIKLIALTISQRDKITNCGIHCCTHLCQYSWLKIWWTDVSHRIPQALWKCPPYVFKCLKYETRNMTQTDCVQ